MENRPKARPIPLDEQVRDPQIGVRRLAVGRDAGHVHKVGGIGIVDADRRRARHGIDERDKGVPKPFRGSVELEVIGIE